MALNASKVKGNNSGTKQELVAVGMYPARVAQVLDLGLQARKAWKGKDKGPANQIWVTYELVSEFMKDEDGKDVVDKPRWQSEKMNLFSLDQENATSTKRIGGLDPTGELQGDWGAVGGTACLVQMVHSRDGQYANIGSVSPPMNGMVTPPLQAEPKIFSMDEPDMELFNSLPDFLKDMMTSNLEFKGSALEAAISGTTQASPPAEQEEHQPQEAPDADAPY